MPISWVRVDPHAELLASVQVLQPPGMWSAQLDFSRDVAAQSAAVAGLAAERPFSYKALNALQGCLENPKVYCRYESTSPDPQIEEPSVFRFSFVTAVQHAALCAYTDQQGALLICPQRPLESVLAHIQIDVFTP